MFEKAVAITTRNVSGGGLSFETDERIPLTARSKIVMGGLGDLPAGALIEGRVVYRDVRPSDGEGGSGERYSIGVRFTGFVNTSREEILERLAAWQEAVAPRPSASSQT